MNLSCSYLQSKLKCIYSFYCFTINSYFLLFDLLINYYFFFILFFCFIMYIHSFYFLTLVNSLKVLLNRKREYVQLTG